MPDRDKLNKLSSIPPNGRDNLIKPMKEKGLMNTEDRISEILYGLIMALTFTCTFSITKSVETSVDDMLFGALSCNTAWGLIDAVMFLVMAKTDYERNFTILNFVRRSKNTEESCQFIADALPPDVANVLQPGEVETIRQRILQMPDTGDTGKRKIKDYKAAAEIFLIVSLSTFPVAVPFVFIADLHTALRISNIIAIMMMFFCGCALGKYAGGKRFLTGVIMSLLGIVLVLITIALGG